MINNSNEINCSVYTGNAPFIFVSYSHKDSNLVLPFIQELQKNYNVWYDEGIDPGTEWDENIARHVKECGYFIACMTKNYLDSSNCKDELNFARDLDKSRLLIYFEKVELPIGMQMRLNRLQSIHKYTYHNEFDFYAKLYRSEDISVCLSEKTGNKIDYTNGDKNVDSFDVQPKAKRQASPLSDFEIKDGILKKYIGKGVNVIIPDWVTAIDNFAFSSCKTLTSIDIPNSVTSIGIFAFKDCSSLTSVLIGNGVNLIDNYVFAYCKSLKRVTIGNSVTSIGERAFDDCSSLTSIEIPNSVTSIGERAFSNCKSLTSVTIGNGVTSIGNYAFEYCYKLVEIINLSKLDIKKGSYGLSALNVKTCGTSDIVNKDGYLFYTVNNTNYLFGYVGNETELVLPDNYNGQSYEIYDNAFDDCSSLTSVEIPNNVKSIGSGAFSNCISLTNIEIHNGVTLIGEWAFYMCSILTNIEIPNSVTIIGDNAFYNCIRLKSVTIGNSVTSIGERAFSNCKSLTSVTIGNSVTSIGYGAFSGCSSLTSIEIPNSVILIDNGAFSNCKSLTSIMFKGTEVEWQTIPKESNWRYKVPATVVHCVDGDIDI